MTLIVSVMKSLAGDARNITAPTRSSGVCARGMARPSMRAARYFGSELSTCVSLSVLPGETAFTVMPWGPTSRASARVKPTTPAFDVV